MLHLNVCSYEYIQYGLIPHRRSHVPIGSSSGHNYRSYLKFETSLLFVDSGYSGMVRKKTDSSQLFFFFRPDVSQTKYIVCLQKHELWTSEAEGRESNFILEIINHFNYTGMRLTAVWFLVQLHWDSIWAYNNLHLKELEILRKVTYYLRYDKSGLKRFCFSGPELFLL